MQAGDISFAGHRMMEVIGAARKRRTTPQRIMNVVDYYRDINKRRRGGRSDSL